jgi:hypothetical protein
MLVRSKLALSALLAVACATGPTRSVASADRCPHGVLKTQADLDTFNYWGDKLCPANAAPDPRYAAVTPLRGTMCLQFGSAFEAGECGAPRDLGRAGDLYRRACAVGFEPGCSNAQRLGK